MRRSSGYPLLVILPSLLLASCSGDDGFLLAVDVVTDLVPGVEVEVLRAELLLAEGPSGSDETAVVTAEVQAVDIEGLSTRGGRVAEFGGLAPGDYVVRVQALLDDDYFVAQRSVTVELTSSVGVSVILSRSCRGVSCPEAGGSARQTSCVGGECAVPSCLTGREDGCPPRECNSAAECPAAADTCGTPTCTNGLCIVSLDDTACAEGERCHPELGCVSATECSGLTEICNGFDDNCNGAVDEDFDLTTDIENCGACGTSCGAENAQPQCVDAACDNTCNPGFLDCNGDPSDGCESSRSSPESCNDCETTCEDPTPLCALQAGGSYACLDDCPAGTTLCDASCVDTATDVSHCGECGNGCVVENAAPACDAGACVVGTCNPGFGNCDGSPDACETELDTPSDCGACGAPCSPANGEGTCASGTCRVTACESGFGDCDGDSANGCESGFDTLTNCGGCGIACERSNGSASCATETCLLTMCDAGYEDCDGMESNGCESLFTNTDCGICGMACAPYRATGTCGSGTCRIASCNTGWDDCIGGDADGCETSLRDVANCGGCGTVCTREHARPTCATGACAIGRCDPGWDDCDGMDSTGCEADIRSDRNNCGMCGNVCPAGETCYLFGCTADPP